MYLLEGVDFWMVTFQPTMPWLCLANHLVQIAFSGFDCSSMGCREIVHCSHSYIKEENKRKVKGGSSWL